MFFEGLTLYIVFFLFVCVISFDFLMVFAYYLSMRLDQELVNRKLYISRSKAVAAIKAGLVFVNGKSADKPSISVSQEDKIEAGALPYVSGRGSLKLQKALEFFKINPVGYVCLDVGASTGGFTEVLLNNGAKKVIAVDVGDGQMVAELKNDRRVLSLEKTDIRKLKPFDKIDLIVVDVSFISLSNIAECLAAWGAKKIIVLIKPQFEVPREIAAKHKGVIKSEQDRQNAVDKVCSCFEKLGFGCVGFVKSPILGGSGNVEFLACFEKTN